MTTAAQDQAIAALHEAVTTDNITELEKLLKNATNVALVGQMDENGFALLHRVVRQPEQIPMLKAILKAAGASINSKKFDIDVIGLDKETPFYMSVHNNNLEAAKILLQAGAKMNVSCGLSQQRADTPLHVAVKFGYTDMVAWLMSNGAEINARDGWRMTPVITAAKYNRPLILHALLASGATASGVDADGKDALYHASENRHTYCVTLLKADRKNLSEALSHVKTEMKLEKPGLHSSDQLMAMLASNKKKQEESEQKQQKAAAEAQQQPQNEKENSKKAPSSKANASSVAIAVAASGGSSSSSSSNKSDLLPKKKNTSTAAAAASSIDETPPSHPASGSVHVAPTATRTHDPLTGKKLPTVKTLEEVASLRQQEEQQFQQLKKQGGGQQIPAELVRPVPKPEFEVGGTSMVVGTGVEEFVGYKGPRKALFIDSIGSVPDYHS